MLLAHEFRELAHEMKTQMPVKTEMAQCIDRAIGIHEFHIISMETEVIGEQLNIIFAGMDTIWNFNLSSAMLDKLRLELMKGQDKLEQTIKHKRRLDAITAKLTNKVLDNG